MHSILHDWSDMDARKILTRIHEAMKPGYIRLLIQESVITPTKANPLATTMDVIQMMLTGGLERSSEQWNKLLNGAGLKIVTVYPPFAGTYESVIEVDLV